MPIIAVADKLKNLLDQSGQKSEFLLVSNESIFNLAASNAGIPIKNIKAYKLRRYWSSKNITEIVNLPIGFFQSLWRVYKFMPDVIFAKGGYVSLPVVAAAWIFRIPIIIHESDSVAGLANSIAAKMANKVAISFRESGNFFPEKKIVFTGNPVRAGILNGDRAGAYNHFGLKTGLPTLLALGGSQGAQKINDILLEIVPKLVAKMQIIHICGIKNYNDIKQAMNRWRFTGVENYHIFPFLYDNLRDAYAVSDLVVSRAGANNIAEIANVGKPAILIPLSSSAGDHQLKNAYYFASRNAAILLEETNLTPHMLYDAIFKILENKALGMNMVRAAHKLIAMDSADRIAKEIFELGK